MTATIGEALDALRSTFPDGFDSCVQFEITGIGCLVLDAGGAREGNDNACCTMRADADTFAAVLSGRADPSQLFFSGRLQIEGDLGVAMRLGQQLQ